MRKKGFELYTSKEEVKSDKINKRKIGGIPHFGTGSPQTFFL